MHYNGERYKNIDIILKPSATAFMTSMAPSVPKDHPKKKEKKGQ